MFTRRYSEDPEDKARFTRRFDRAYSFFATSYDFAVKHLPVWKTWLNQAIPHIVGPKVLEISFGTGYLLTQYANRFECIGLEYNENMVETARKNMEHSSVHGSLLRGSVDSLPFSDGTFDCVVNTMAFSGYPDADRAIGEIRRVLKPGGRLVMIDICHPNGSRRAGIFLTNLWRVFGDLIRRMPEILNRAGFEFTDEEIGGFGSVHLYVGRRRD